MGETPTLVQSHEDFLKYLAGGAASSLDFGSNEQVLQVLAELEKFTDVIQDVKTKTITFRGLMAQLPRMTVIQNRAKRRAAGVLENLVATFAELIAKNLRVRDDLSALVTNTEEIP